MDQQRELARLVWQGVNPDDVPPDYQGYYNRDRRLANGPYPDDPTPEKMVEQGTSFLVGAPDDCIKFLETYESLGIEQVFTLCAIDPAEKEEVMNIIRLFRTHVIPYFKAKEKARKTAA